MTTIPGTDLDVFPLCFGGNVLGWTADRDASFAVLDAYAAAGGNFLDTADMYGDWVPGNEPGASERIIGEWMAARGNRDAIVVATKVGGDADLKAETIRTHVEISLERLRTDRIDLYYAHWPDADTPLEETLGAFDALVRAGKVRHVAVSNFDAALLTETLAICDREGFARPVALQPHYNLMKRDDYEGALQQLAVRERLAVFPYYALGSGFLTGKYRTGGPAVESARAGGAGRYLEDPRAPAVLAALDEIAAAHDTSVAAVALAWLLAQPGIVAPIASARTPAQLAELLPCADLRLAGEELARLSAASELVPTP